MSGPAHLRLDEDAPKKPGPVDVKRWITNLAGARDLWPMTRLIGVYIASLYHPKKGYAYPSQQTIADHLGIHRRDVRRAVDQLEQAGWFIVKRGQGRGNSSEDRPNFDREKGA
jgi:biotin operon repressor